MRISFMNVDQIAIFTPFIIPNDTYTPIYYSKKDRVTKVKEIFKTYDRLGRERFVYPSGMFVDVEA